MGSGLILLGRFDEAATVARRALDLAPDNDRSRYNLGMTFLLTGNPGAALQVFDQLQGPIFQSYARTQALYALGRQAEADAEFANLKENYGRLAAFQVALVYGFLDDYDSAFEWLDKAYEYRDFGVSFTRAGLAFRKMRDDPRWEPYLQKIGWSDEQLAGVKF
jgi:tetratricopeptide (TPR) repeat protein